MLGDTGAKALSERVYTSEGTVEARGSLDGFECYVRHMAFTLHDGPAQTMGMASAMLDDALHEDDPLALRSLLVASQGLVERSLNDLRDVFSELRPSALDAGSLTEQIADYLHECREAYGVPVALEVRGNEPRLSPRARTAAFRIAQEALNNVRRHARCMRAIACLDYDPEGVTVTVCDDGRGFDPSGVDVLSWGIRGMLERARLAGGYAEIRSAPGAGTVVSARIPREGSW